MPRCGQLPAALDERSQLECFIHRRGKGRGPVRAQDATRYKQRRPCGLMV